ncbi:MAG: DNA-3-methyladenine glycosylase [Hadesarchaea archaeon]|nr:DNA-3-methyladenine glycosylase [Hadesarchaea archaeon]
MKAKILPRCFYERDTARVAQDLLGKVLIHDTPEGTTSGKIVETEAYLGREDPASRASRKRTRLNEIMWSRGGLAFVYVVHAQNLFNVTTEEEGTPGAVLVRAVEPLGGLELMRERRGVSGRELTSGPGRLTQAMGITRAQHGLDLTDPRSELKIVEGGSEEFEIGKSHRIGVSRDLERELRFFIRKNPFVSR